MMQGFRVVAVVALMTPTLTVTGQARDSLGFERGFLAPKAILASIKETPNLAAADSRLEGVALNPAPQIRPGPGSYTVEVRSTDAPKATARVVACGGEEKQQCIDWGLGVTQRLPETIADIMESIRKEGSSTLRLSHDYDVRNGSMNFHCTHAEECKWVKKREIRRDPDISIGSGGISIGGTRETEYEWVCTQTSRHRCDPT